MKTFTNIDPNTLDSDPRIILKFVEPNEIPTLATYYYLLKEGDHLIWALTSPYPEKDAEAIQWSGSTEVEFPVAGLAWFINILEQQFFKSAAEGGLPKGKYAFEEEVMGERLCVSRMFGTPGYGFRNYSRKDYLTKLYDKPQQANFSDELLFTKGLFEQFKFIALQLEDDVYP